jgi:hypothetical protein
MTRRVAMALVALVLAAVVTPHAEVPSASPPSGANGQRHHYAINARVRPLLLFWISPSGVGDAILTRRQGPSDAAYSLLIGSDPDRAPRRINRWGYIDEEIRGAEATLIGLMTESDEDSIEQAEANIRKQAGGRTFKIIRATVDGNEARSVVTSVDAPADYSFRQVDAVLDFARTKSSPGKTRVIQLPAGTRPGFLAALAEMMHAHAIQWRTSARIDPGHPIPYVYHGRILELTATRTQPMASVRVNGISYTNVIKSDFEVRSTYDGELTRFSMTYGADGALAETPIAASYQPRWWLQIDLALDDTTSGPALASGMNP